MTANIPVGGSAAAGLSNRTGFSIQQSHWNLWASTPTAWGDLEVFT